MSTLADIVTLKDAEQRYSPRWYALDRIQALMLEDEQLTVEDAILALVENETVAYLRGSNDKEQFGAVIDIAVMAGVQQATCHMAVARAAEREMKAEYGDDAKS